MTAEVCLMKSKFIFSVVAGFLCTFPQYAAATSAEQSLLEAWAFAYYRGAISIERFHTAADGALMPPADPEMNKETDSWFVIDKPNCIILGRSSMRTATEYYLNNISGNRPTIYKSDDTFHIGLMGDEPIRCQIEKSNKQCDYFFTLPVVGADRYRAVIDALDRIYTSFCRYAR